jgi:hypothetical protein
MWANNILVKNQTCYAPNHNIGDVSFLMKDTLEEILVISYNFPGRIPPSIPTPRCVNLMGVFGFLHKS